MAQCSASDLIAEACQSGFTCRSEPELLALLNQLLCNFTASGGGGADAPFTTEVFEAPALPFVFTATRRSTVEMQSFFSGAVGFPGLQIARTGVPALHIFTQAGTDSRSNESYQLGPGDTITITDESGVGGIAAVERVIVYIQ